VRSPHGETRQLEPAAIMTPKDRLVWGDGSQFYFQYLAEQASHARRAQSVEYGNDAILWKLPDFAFYADQADRMLDQIRSHKALVLDLRGNPGGFADFLGRLLGGMLDHSVKLGDRVGRKGSKPVVTKSRGDKTFDGKLIVLIDSQSASASEVFARVIQLENRGTVLGDRSSGSVMEGQEFTHRIGTEMHFTLYGDSVTGANLVMVDGKSLENVGVVPDEVILPTSDDLANGRDPVLARAAALVGVTLTPEQAGKLFPIKWDTD
jgi:C-terminal processing protease CtpA/Prc